MFCVIWYYFYNLQNAKNTHGGVCILVNVQASNFTKSSASWVFFTFLNLSKCHQIKCRKNQKHSFNFCEDLCKIPRKTILEYKQK